MNAHSEMTVSFPEILLVASKESPEQFKQRVLLQTLGSLYVEGKISAGMAADIMGCTRWEFYEMLSDSGFPVIDYEPEDELSELESGRALANQLRK